MLLFSFLVILNKHETYSVSLKTVSLKGSSRSEMSLQGSAPPSYPLSHPSLTFEELLAQVQSEQQRPEKNITVVHPKPSASSSSDPQRPTKGVSQKVNNNNNVNSTTVKSFQTSETVVAPTTIGVPTTLRRANESPNSRAFRTSQESFQAKGTGASSSAHQLTRLRPSTPPPHQPYAHAQERTRSPRPERTQNISTGLSVEQQLHALEHHYPAETISNAVPPRTEEAIPLVPQQMGVTVDSSPEKPKPKILDHRHPTSSSSSLLLQPLEPPAPTDKGRASEALCALLSSRGGAQLRAVFLGVQLRAKLKTNFAKSLVEQIKDVEGLLKERPEKGDEGGRSTNIGVSASSLASQKLLLQNKLVEYLEAPGPGVGKGKDNKNNNRDGPPRRVAPPSASLKRGDGMRRVMREREKKQQHGTTSSSSSVPPDAGETQQHIFKPTSSEALVDPPPSSASFNTIKSLARGGGGGSKRPATGSATTTTTTSPPNTRRTSAAEEDDAHHRVVHRALSQTPQHRGTATTTGPHQSNGGGGGVGLLPSKLGGTVVDTPNRPRSHSSSTTANSNKKSTLSSTAQRQLPQKAPPEHARISKDRTKCVRLISSSESVENLSFITAKLNQMFPMQSPREGSPSKKEKGVRRFLNDVGAWNTYAANEKELAARRTQLLSSLFSSTEGYGEGSSASFVPRLQAHGDKGIGFTFLSGSGQPQHILFDSTREEETRTQLDAVCNVFLNKF